MGEEIPSTLGYFVGKEIKGSGTSKAGKEWEVWQLKFKPSMESEKSFSMSAFNPLSLPKSLQFEDLKEGTRYKVMYNEKPYMNKITGKEAIGKTACGMFIPSEDDQNKPYVAPQQQATPVQSTGIDLTKFDSFAEGYIKLLKDKGMMPSLVHMIGSFVATNEKIRIAGLVTKCREFLDKV